MEKEELKHTKGPWEVSADNSFECGVLTSKDEHFIDVQNSDMSENGFFEMMANAKIIAAAPDMLEALIWAKDQFKKLSDEGRYPEFMLAKNGGEGIMPLIKAINKATNG